MKKISLFLCMMFMFIPIIVFGETVTTVEGYKAAMADEDVSEVKLGANITLTDSDVLYHEYELNIKVKKELDLNGYTLTQDDTVRANATFTQENGTLTITDKVGTGKLICHTYFAEVHNDVENSLIKLENFDYENINNGNSILFPYGEIPALVTVKDVNFFYPKNSPLRDGFDNIVYSLTVTETQDNPVGFFNDSYTTYVNNVVHSESNIYVDGEYFDGDWTTTYARDVFLGSGAVGHKIVIKDYCTITFETNGGSTIDPIDVSKGKTFGEVKPKNDPTKTDYSFYSWYEDNNEWKKNFTNSSIVDRDITLYARYGRAFELFAYNTTTNQIGDGCKVRHPSGYEGYSGSGIALEGEPLKFEAVPLPGIVFLGWAEDSVDGTIVSEDPEITFTYDGDIYGKYYALFERGIDVSFETYGGSEVESQTIKKGTTATLPTQPTKEGYSFDGWYTDNTFTHDFYFDTVLNEDTVIYAKWLENIKIANANFAIPYATMKPDMEVVSSDPSKYTVSLTSIYDNVEGYPHLDSSSVYELGHTYTFRIVFEAKPGYKLTDDTVYTFNGEETESYGSFRFRQNDYVANEIPEVTKPVVKISNNNNKMNLNWDNQLRATKYIVYKSTDGKKFSKVKEVTTNSYSEKGLTYGKTYYYKVKACDTSKCSGYSDVVSRKIRPNKTTLTIKSAGTNNVKLGWDKVSVNGYEIYRSTDGKKYSLVKTYLKNSTIEFNNKKLSANKTYYYKIRAFKIEGSKLIYGPYSDVVSTKTAPNKPTLSLALKDYNAINIVIGSTKGAVNYVVQKSLDGKTYATINNLPGPGTLADEGLELGKTYYYAIKACNSHNRCSGWVKANLKQTTKTPGFSLKTSSKKVTITMSKVNGADGYQIYRATSKNGKYEKVKEFSSEVELLEFVNKTTKGKTYYYKVRSFALDEKNARVYSPYSKIKSIISK